MLQAHVRVLVYTELLFLIKGNKKSLPKCGLVPIF